MRGGVESLSSPGRSGVRRTLKEEELMTAEATRILQTVRDLAPMINARGAEIEAVRRIPPDLLTELIAAGCFRMLVPRGRTAARRSTCSAACKFSKSWQPRTVPWAGP